MLDEPAAARVVIRTGGGGAAEAVAEVIEEKPAQCREPRVGEAAHGLVQKCVIRSLLAADVQRAVEKLGEFVGLEFADRPPL